MSSQSQDGNERKVEINRRQEGESAEGERDHLVTMQTVETTSSSGASTSSPLITHGDRVIESAGEAAVAVAGQGQVPSASVQVQVDNANAAQQQQQQRISWETGNTPVTSSPSRVTVKLLVSNNMAGSIIGRSGQTISNLQSQSSSKIRLSQSGDYFPGTSDRICLIHGPLDNVKKGVALVLGKLYTLQLELLGAQLQLGHTIGQENDDSLADGDAPSEQVATGPDAIKMTFTARILISSAACGMLIGKEGSSIKKLKDDSGASSVRLSPKVTDHRTFERILTVQGNDLQSCVSFSESLLDGFVRHPEICRYLNSTTSYSRSANIPYSVPRNTGPSLGYPSPASNRNPITNIPRQSYGQPPHQHQAIHEMEAGMHGLKFDPQQTNHNVPSPGRGGRRQPSYMPAPVNAMNVNVPRGNTFHHNHPPPQGPGQVPMAQIPGPAVQPPQNLHPNKMQLAVPDSMVGAILGRRGQTLMELQAESGARIKVSQRDEFVPGTSNRIIIITGSNESIATARNLIRQLLSRNP